MRIRCENAFFISLLVIAVISLPLALSSACSGNVKPVMPVVSDYLHDTTAEIFDLRVGVVSGPYWDMFEEAVMPLLNEKGYTATFICYDDFSKPNFALAQNDIDLNIFQHYVYLNTFKFENDLALSAIMEIPTVSMSLFSHRFISLSEIGAGITVSIPDDASNLARALRVLESANILTLDPSIDKSKATLADVVDNPFFVRLKPLKAHDLVESLKTHDMSVINGNFAISGGLNLSEALYQELLVDNYMNVVAVRTEDLNKRFVRDIIEVIYSDSFRDIVSDLHGNFAGFQWPRWLHDSMGS